MNARIGHRLIVAALIAIDRGDERLRRRRHTAIILSSDPEDLRRIDLTLEVTRV